MLLQYVYFMCFYEAACRYNSLQRFCCVDSIGFSMKGHVVSVRCNVFAGSVLWLFIWSGMLVQLVATLLLYAFSMLV